MLAARFRHDLPLILNGLQKEYRVLSQHKLGYTPSKDSHIVVSFTNGDATLPNAIHNTLQNRVQAPPLLINIDQAPFPDEVQNFHHRSIDVRKKEAQKQFESEMRSLIPNSIAADQTVFERRSEQFNVLGKVDTIDNVLIDMRVPSSDGDRVVNADTQWPLLARKSLNVCKLFWSPRTVVCCAGWDGPDARELLSQLRYRFKNVFYVVQAESVRSSKLLLLNRASKGSMHGFSAFESEAHLGAPAFLVCQYPTDGVLDVVDRRATRKHPTGREHVDPIPIRRSKWQHHSPKVSARDRPLSFIDSQPMRGDLDGGAARSRLRHESRAHFQRLTSSVLRNARQDSLFRKRR